MDNNTFESTYCSVIYDSSLNAAVLTWKCFASFDNYRKPTTFALDILKNHKNAQFIIDARNGFEDDPADVEWGFSYLLPAMSETDCKTVIFIMNEVHQDIEEEMDMWTKEFSRYFTVLKTDSFEKAVEMLQK
ncbi:MAG: hypothetical protein Q4F95_01165 [Oscillospiraceae bacterium]|nr:hypothetical protein [Oscillospiraceae bacterium]